MKHSLIGICFIVSVIGTIVIGFTGFLTGFGKMKHMKFRDNLLVARWIGVFFCLCFAFGGILNTWLRVGPSMAIGTALTMVIFFLLLFAD